MYRFYFFLALFLLVIPGQCSGRFALPSLGVRDWAVHDSALKIRLGPLHSDLSSDAISPSEAARRFSTTLADFLGENDVFKKGEGGGTRRRNSNVDTSDEAFRMAKLEKKRLQRLVFGRNRRVEIEG